MIIMELTRICNCRYGIVKYEGNKFTSVDYGAITTESSMELPKRLLVLYNGLKEIIEKYRPEAIAVEELFSIKI